MEDDPCQYAARALHYTNCDHHSLLPPSYWCMRMLCLGLVSNRVQAVPFYTSLSIVSIFIFGACSRETWELSIPSSALLWRKAYYFFVIVFPVLASTAYLVAVLKTHSVQQMDDLHCDNTSPLWYVSCLLPVSSSRFNSLALVRPRLLGYAGAPIVLYTPCFILSILTAVRILEMRTRLRGLQSQNGNQSQSTQAGNNSPPMPMPERLFASPMGGVSDKFSSQTLDDQTGMRYDLQLDHSLTRFSSRISLPWTPGTVESMSSNTHLHLPIELPALSPLIVPSIHPSPPSPTPSNNSVPFLSIDRSKTPSPIVFASAYMPSLQCHQGQPDATGESSSSCHASSTCGPGMPNSIHSDERQPSLISTSRAPILIEVGEKMPGFHLPIRSPPNSLRPSLELSPEYVRAQFEEDRAAGNPFASSGSLHRLPHSTLVTRSTYDVIGSLPSITCIDRALERLPEVDEADRASALVKSEDKFASKSKVSASVERDTEPPLKPVRQFYRESDLPPLYSEINKLSAMLPQDRLVAPL
jgi:hypothetical protein